MIQRPTFQGKELQYLLYEERLQKHHVLFERLPKMEYRQKADVPSDPASSFPTLYQDDVA